MNEELEKRQLKAAIEVIMVVANTIKELGHVPSGYLYARMAPHMDLHTYTSIVEQLKDCELIEEKFHVLYWVGGPRGKVIRI